MILEIERCCKMAWSPFILTSSSPEEAEVYTICQSLVCEHRHIDDVERNATKHKKWN